MKACGSARGQSHAAEDTKVAVQRLWDRPACGEAYCDGSLGRQRFEAQGKTRYGLEPFIHSFARFSDDPVVDVLEIGLATDADHLEWAAVGPRCLLIEAR